MRIEIQSTLVKRDSDGALFVRYTPVAKSCTCLSTGELSFACWEAAVGGTPGEHAMAQQKARDSAIKSFRLLAEQLN